MKAQCEHLFSYDSVCWIANHPYIRGKGPAEARLVFRPDPYSGRVFLLCGRDATGRHLVLKKPVLGVRCPSPAPKFLRMWLELADTLASKTSASGRAGSTPVIRTKFCSSYSWESGYPVACKASYAGSNPVEYSSLSCAPAAGLAQALVLGTSELTLNEGSTPFRGTKKFWRDGRVRLIALAC